MNGTGGGEDLGKKIWAIRTTARGFAKKCVVDFPLHPAGVFTGG
jgi:hypothetical protein